MAEQNPTVIIAHLNDDALKKSIDSLVGYVDEKFKAMTTSTTLAVSTMQKELQKLGSLNTKGVGGAGGGELGITKALQGAKQEAKESSIIFDQMTASMQKATTGNGNKTIFSTMNTEISILKERLVEAKSQVESFTVMARRGAETGDKGLFVFSTENLHKYEAEVATLTQQINNLTSQRQAMKEMLNPQGDAFKNYVDSLTKANPELAALNAQYREGKSLLQQQTSEIKRRNQEEQNSGRTAKEIAQDQKRYIEQNRQSEQARKQATIETGIAAQQTARTIVASMQAQSQANVDNNIDKPITGYKELEKVIKDMRSAYAAMSDEQKKSQDGLNLQYSIDQAKKAKQAVEEYNREIAGMGISSRKNVGYQSDSYAALSKQLSNTVKGFQNLSGAKRDAEQGTVAINKIHQLRLALREIQNQMNRPISLSKAMGLEENTLDRIAYKIQQLNAYRGGLNITDQKQVGEMRTVENEIDRLKKKQDELMGKNQQLMNSNNALARSWNYMKNRLAFYFTVGASTQFVKNLIEVRSQYEMNERALGILIDSAERGTQIFNELSQMALVSPYTLIELSTAAKQLSAYDVAAKDLVDTTRRLADISAAVGLPVERLTMALGQIKAFEHLTSMTARRFSSAGIPLIKALADHYTELEGKMVSVADVYDRMKKKAISYNDVMAVITEMTDEGGKFFDFQAKMANTLKVQLANLTLAWNNMLNEIGKSEQGVLVGGIKGLKELFLQWENINKAIRNVIVTLGLVKAAQLVYYFAVRNSNNAIALHNVLGNKMSRNLKEIAVGFRNAKNAITGASTAMKSFVLTTIAIAAIATAVVELAMAWKDAEEGVKDFNKSIRDGATENYKNITNTIEQYKDLRESLYKEEERGGNNVRVAQDIDESNAKKAWESMREEIELSSAASEKYISRLMQIDNVSERLRQGFILLDDLQAVNSALSEMGDKTIFIQQDWSSWWNLWLAPDSFEENLRDFIKAKKQIEDAYGDIETAREKLEKASSVGDKNLKSGVSRYDNTLEQFRENLKETTDSLIDFISLKGWTGDTNKINEFFAQFTNKTVMQLGLDPSEAFTLQLEVEQARAKAAKQSLQIRLEDEKQALKAARDEETKEAIQANIDELQAELNDFDKNNGRGRVLWENYTKWMKEQHMSEMTQMFRNMDAEDIKSLNFQEGKYAEWVTRMVTQYAKEHKMSIDDVERYLKNFVRNANQMSIFIPLTISTEDKKSVYDRLGEYDKIIDDADSQIKRLTTRIGELQAKQKLSKEETEELADAQNELAKAERDKADAEAKGGHGKQEAKDTKNAAKAQKQAETELQKALKDELQLLDKVRSQYKKLTDAGVDGTTALNMVTNQFTNSIQRINNILGKNGLPLFNIKAFAGTDNPNAVLEMLKKQLDAAKVAKNIKPSEIKELEVKYGEIVIDAKVYNTKKIADGLNNELSKIKDEYELAVELDANPELGNIFMDIFDIDPNNIPNTIDAYAKSVMDALNRSFEKQGKGVRLDTLSLTDDDLKAYKAESEKQMGAISEEDYKNIEKYTKEIRNLRKKDREDTLKQTQDLQYKLGDVNEKIAIDSKKLADLQVKYQKETNDEKKRLLDLQIKDQENAIAKLGEEVMQMLPTYKNLFNSIAEHSAAVTRRIAKQWKDALENAVKNPDGSYTITDPKSGEKATLSEKEYGRQLDKVNGKLRETQSSFSKINEAFTKGEDGEIDFAKGLEYVAEEANKAANGLHTIADIVEALGGSEDAVEVLNDVATSMEGVATAGQGIAQISSGDYIGGAVNVIKGTWQAISTWLDNGDKKISRQIEESERHVKALETSYQDLQDAMEDAYGYGDVAAKRATITNKELQLVELQRQLQLEKSRKKKNQDANRIMELQSAIINLRNELDGSTKDIVNDLLGISSVGDAAEQLVSSMIDAFKNGEDYMKVYEDSFEDMIDNLIMKAIVGEIVGRKVQQMFDAVEKESTKRADKTAYSAKMPSTRDMLEELYPDYGITEKNIRDYNNIYFNRIREAQTFEEVLSAYEKSQAEALQRGEQNFYDMLQKQKEFVLSEYADAATIRPEDLRVLTPEWKESWMEGVDDMFKSTMDTLGITFGEGAEKSLSNLQQGIQGITEETAGALEAYMNGVSQQVYLQSDLLTQIRDAVVAFDNDVQIATNAQILLQLQQSYAVQMAIQSILVGWSNPSGQAVRVELLS